MNIRTNIFKISAGEYMRPLFMGFLDSRWYVFVLFILPIVGLSFWNINFIYVALIAVFFVFPMSLSYVYFYHAFSPECVEAIRQGKMEFDENGIRHIYTNDEFEQTSFKEYSWTDFSNYEFGSKYIKLYLKNSKHGLLIVPIDSFESDMNNKDVRNLIEQKINLL